MFLLKNVLHFKYNVNVLVCNTLPLNDLRCYCCSIICIWQCFQCKSFHYRSLRAECFAGKLFSVENYAWSLHEEILNKYVTNPPRGTCNLDLHVIKETETHFANFLKLCKTINTCLCNFQTVTSRYITPRLRV